MSDPFLDFARADPRVECATELVEDGSRGLYGVLLKTGRKFTMGALRHPMMNEGARMSYLRDQFEWQVSHDG